MTERVSLLLVEDSPPDAALAGDQVAAAAGPRLALRAAASVAEALTALAEEPPDCLLLDLSLPDASDLEALAVVRQHAPDVPIVVLCGADAEDLAIRAVAEGAQDYLVKGQAPAPLVLRAVRYAIERKEAERELQAVALTDSLTGLPNRTRLMDRIGHALERSRRTGTGVALLLCDLDRFKLVNDSLGHSAGDRLLIAVAERLRRAVRPSDTVARLGGDEFVVLCEDLAGPECAEAVVERIHVALAVPVEVENTELVPTASIGLALATASGDTAERLLSDADAAMYRAKAEGRSHAHFAADFAELASFDDAAPAVRVFLCDDADDVRALLRAALEVDDRLTVVGEAGDGASIVDAVAASLTDVVVIDLSMPRVDGLEAITALRAWSADLGIVVLSGFEQARVRDRAVALGADRYVEKRASMAEVCATVREVADAQRGGRERVVIPTRTRSPAA